MDEPTGIAYPDPLTDEHRQMDVRARLPPGGRAGDRHRRRPARHRPGGRRTGARTQMRPYLEKYFAGAVPAAERLALINLASDLLAREYAGYQSVLAVHAEGSLEAEKLMISRSYDPSERGRLRAATGRAARQGRAAVTAAFRFVALTPRAASRAGPLAASRAYGPACTQPGQRFAAGLAGLGETQVDLARGRVGPAARDDLAARVEVDRSRGRRRASRRRATPSSRRTSSRRPEPGSGRSRRPCRRWPRTGTGGRRRRRG